jgi:hypothetical protein
MGNENCPLLLHSPKLDSLREEPRFRELLEELRQRWEARMSRERGDAA